MESITKTPLNKEKIESLVKNAFGNKVNVITISELEDGWFNAIYLVALDDNREVVLKVAPSPEIKVLRYEKNIMNAEVEVMKLLKSSTKIPVPEIYYYDTSKNIINNEYYFMEKIQGQPYSKIKENLPECHKESIEIELGRYNRQINDIKNDRFGNVGQMEKMNFKWSETFFNLVKDILLDGQEYEVKLPFDYDYIEALFLEKTQVLDLVTEPSLVHWDLHDGNVFVDESTYKITGIIDFERAFWGDPLIEVYFGDFFNKKYFTKGYGIELITTKEAECRRILYNIYLYLIMVIECKYRHVENQGHIKWTYEMLESEINKYIRANKFI